jgi:16S rRNA (cytosine1402-N4)-methyltransferase
LKSKSIDSSDQNDNTSIYASTGEKHVPVLLQEALELLNIRPAHLYIDATAGGGGHLSGILESLPGGTTTQAVPTKAEAQDGKQKHAGVIAVDRDLAALNRLQERFGNRAQFWHCTYDRIKERLHDQGILTVDGGILADLGVSSMQLDNPARGFSFMQEGPLDMRMDQNQSLSAEELINSLSEEELADIIFNYGEERFSRAIARGIVRARPLHTTTELSDVVMRSLRHQKQRISSSSKKRQTLSYSTHPATRTFQAISNFSDKRPLHVSVRPGSWFARATTNRSC